MNEELSEQIIRNKIFTIRGVQVLLDRDLAELYGVSTKALNQAVKRNKQRFPEDFMFKLSQKEDKFLRSQTVTSNNRDGEKTNLGGRRYLPYAFTEQGVAALSGVLKSVKAIEINISIIRAFVSMRKFLSKNANIFLRLNCVEKKQLDFQLKIEKNFEIVFEAIEDRTFKKKQGIFYDGQIFEAYKFVSELIKTAKKSIVLIDNYVDESVLTLFSKRNKNVSVTIYTNNLSEKLKLDVKKFNSQYGSISVAEFKKSHDRFLIIDEKDIYHFGASLKDVGKKWFAFSKFELDALIILKKLNYLDNILENHKKKYGNKKMSLEELDELLK